MVDSSCASSYCGRMIINDSLGDCGACPRGFQPNIETNICVECTESLSLYDWLYLSFMILVFIVIQCFFIDKSIKSNQFNFLSFILYLAAVGEATLSSAISLFVFNSEWSLKLKTCGVRSLSDWYTLFYNPSANENFNCTQEAVYPLYSIVFLFYLIVLCLVLTRHFYLRLAIFCIYLITSINFVKNISYLKDYPRDHITKNTYYILYSIPALIFTHAVFAGIIYNIFPYLAIIGSIISIAIHFSYHLDQNWIFLLRSMLQFRNFCIILLHWLILAFGIVSLTELRRFEYYLLLLVVPFPTFFYISTSKFTDPANL